MRTQVGIIGAGPAGLLLSRLLALQGIDSVVLENRARAYVEARIRAGILEQHTVDTLTEAGVGDRLHREGLEHHGIYLQYPGTRHKLDFPELCGRTVWVYGQTEVAKDLIAAQLDGGPPLLFEVSDVTPEDVDTDSPRIRFTDADGNAAGARVRRRSPAPTASTARPARSCTQGGGGRVWERTYPYAWLGILADVAPSTDELIYAWHPEGFALHSMRSPKVSRLYLQVDPAREDRGLVRRPDLGQPRDAVRPRRLGAADRAGHREVDPADALVRQRADAPRPAVPRRGRRAHRAADRREGPQPRRRRRHAAGHGAGPAAEGGAGPTWSTATPTARWPGSGGARTSPGG